MRNIRSLLIALLILSFVVTIIAASLTVMTTSRGVRSIFYTIALCCYTVLLILVVFDIVRSKTLNINEKFLWCFAALLGGALGVLIYLLVGKKEQKGITAH